MALHGKRPGEHFLERLDLVNALAGENSFAEKILINVGDRAGIDVEAGVAGKQRGQTRAAGGFDAGVHARLENAIAFDDGIRGGIDHRAIQRMRERADELVRGFARQLRIEIEGDHKLHALNQRKIADLHGKIIGLIQKIAIEVEKLAAFALPAHPDAFGFVENAMAMEMEERALGLRGVFRVQFFDQARAEGREFIFFIELHFRVRWIGEQREMNVGVAIREEANFEIANGVARLLFAGEQGGNHHHRGAIFGNAVGKIETRQLSRPHETRDHEIGYRNGAINRRNQK